MGMTFDDKKRLGIYIHIPFCVQKCLYCDFLSFPSKEKERNEYVNALLSEIEMKSASGEATLLQACTEYLVDTIFIGGGTPSVLRAEQIERILCKLNQCFCIDENTEITIECNPGTVSKEDLLVYKSAGVNRLSFGLQSPEDEDLKTLGRIHTYDEFRNSFRWAREAGFGNINIDLISAIPNQDTNRFLNGLNKVIALNPEHISVYSLIVEEGTPFYEMELELPDEECEREIYHQTQKILAENGYLQYEISNYAKPGYESKHNMKYWMRDEYLGLGLGASSLMKDRRWKNTSDFHQYLNLDFDCEEEEILSKKDKMSETMILGLRMNRGVSKKDFFDKFSEDIYDVYGKELRKHIEEGLLKDTKGTIVLTAPGRDVANYVLCDFV